MKSDRLIFVTSFDYPTRFAHARHGLEMAKAYHQVLGDRFVFFINAAVEPLPIPYRLFFGRFGRRIKKLRLRRLLIPLRLGLFLLLNPQWRRASIVTTDTSLFGPLAAMRKIFHFTLACECHGAVRYSDARALSKADAIIFTTQGLCADFLQKFPDAIDRAHVFPNAVDKAAFDAVTDNKEVLREKLGLPGDAFLVGYIGRFEPLNIDKGLRFMIDALRLLPERVHLVFVGGAKNEVASYRAYVDHIGCADRVHVVPYVPADSVPLYAKSCDALAYVPSEKDPFFLKETSPMKIFEYMAAQRPIIVSDTPAIREILSAEEAFFISPGDVHAFHSVVCALLSGEGMARADRAYERVAKNTWRGRAERIVEIL